MKKWKSLLGACLILAVFFTAAVSAAVTGTGYKFSKTFPALGKNITLAEGKKTTNNQVSTVVLDKGKTCYGYFWLDVGSSGKRLSDSIKVEDESTQRTLNLHYYDNIVLAPGSNIILRGCEDNFWGGTVQGTFYPN